MKTKLLCAAALLSLSFGTLAASDDWQEPSGPGVKAQGEFASIDLKTDDRPADKADGVSEPGILDELLAYFFGSDHAL